MHHIVLLEDDANDAELIERVLQNDGIDATVDVAEDRSDFELLLDRTKIDLVISDSGVGDFSALEAVKLTKAKQPKSGFIIVSGGFDADRAELARRMGAIEWLPKSELNQLPPLARLALEAAEHARHAENTQLENNRLATANRSVQILVEAVTELSTARNLDSVQKIVCAAARAINGADGATIVLREGRQCYYADEDATAPLWKGQRFPMATCVSGWAMLNRRPAIIPDVDGDARIPEEAYRPTFVKSLVVVPIRSADPIGAIGNYWAAPHTPSAAEVQFIQALAESTAVALDNVELYRKLETRVAHRTFQLQEANQSLDEFSYFISHDLRGPLRHINAYATLLEAELRTPSPMARKSLDKIKASTVVMNGMLEGLVGLTRLGGAAVEPAPVDMTALAIKAARHAKEQGAVPVTINVEDLPPAVGNEILLRQVFGHLLSNAVKFSSHRAAPEITVGSKIESDQLRYFVRDNGMGFDMATADQLFMAFRRLHQDTDYSGVGVGLAIVNRIVSRHGGRVWAESEPDQGATFYFTLGLTPPHAIESGAAAA